MLTLKQELEEFEGRCMGLETHSCLDKLENVNHHNNCENHTVVQYTSAFCAGHTKAVLYELCLEGTAGGRVYRGFIDTGQALGLFTEVQ